MCFTESYLLRLSGLSNSICNPAGPDIERSQEIPSKVFMQRETKEDSEKIDSSFERTASSIFITRFLDETRKYVNQTELFH